MNHNKDESQEETLARYGEPSEVIVLKGFASAQVPQVQLRQKISMCFMTYMQWMPVPCMDLFTKSSYTLTTTANCKPLSNLQVWPAPIELSESSMGSIGLDMTPSLVATFLYRRSMPVISFI